MGPGHRSFRAVATDVLSAHYNYYELVPAYLARWTHAFARASAVDSSRDESRRYRTSHSQRQISAICFNSARAGRNGNLLVSRCAIPSRTFEYQTGYSGLAGQIFLKLCSKILRQLFINREERVHFHLLKYFF